MNWWMNHFFDYSIHPPIMHDIMISVVCLGGDKFQWWFNEVYLNHTDISSGMLSMACYIWILKCHVVYMYEWVCEIYVVHVIVSTGLCCAPLTCIVHHQRALCTMVHNAGQWRTMQAGGTCTGEVMHMCPHKPRPCNIRMLGIAQVHSLSKSNSLVKSSIQFHGSSSSKWFPSLNMISIKSCLE